MNAFETFLNIGDVIIKVETPFRFSTESGRDFLCPPQKPDYTFRFQAVDDIPKVMGEAIKVQELLWAHEFRRKEGGYFRAFIWQEYYVAVSEIGPTEGVCYYASSKNLWERAMEGFDLLMYLCLEQILIRFGCLVLHSSHICIQGQGLVFSAPSQTGKSTQAELWRQYAGAEIINGDRSLLRKVNGRWRVYGCPMCGTSQIHKQGSEPLAGIVLLAQAPTCTVQRIRGLQAVRLLYPEITISGWDRSYVDTATELMDQLLTEVPMWRYACTKEPEAVAILKNALGFE